MRKREGISAAVIAGLVVVIALIGFVDYVALNGMGQPESATSTTSSISVTPTQISSVTNSSSIQTTTCGVNFPNAQDVCADLLSNQDLQQLVTQSSSVQHYNGFIVLQVGYGDCINYFYFLSNSTFVEVLSGPSSASSSCA